jgi:hypothetical protein
MKELLERDQDLRIDNAIVYGAFLRDLANRAYRKREFSMADRLLTESIQRLAAIARPKDFYSSQALLTL